MRFIFSFFIVLSFLTFAPTATATAQTFARANPLVAPANPIGNASTEIIIVAGKRFAGGTSRTGSVYVTRTSKAGKEYKQYLGYYTSKKFEGKAVFRNKDASQFFIYDLSRNGWPKKVMLVAQ